MKAYYYITITQAVYIICYKYIYKHHNHFPVNTIRWPSVGLLLTVNSKSTLDQRLMFADLILG